MAPLAGPEVLSPELCAPEGATIFDKILDGSIPCFRIYEDAHVLAFLDIGPLSLGHTLVIPKERAAFLHQLSDASAAAVGRVLPRLARAILAVTQAEGYNVLQNNGAHAHQAVFHVHFHIIPHKLAGPANATTQGLGLDWAPVPLDKVRAAELAEQIRAKL
jgi:histidine triad (HIT) family protein